MGQELKFHLKVGENSLRIPSEFSPSLEMGRSGVATTLSEVLEDSAWEGRVGR